jgi:RNA polymerase sigma factor (sigma-70 family)
MYEPSEPPPLPSTREGLRQEFAAVVRRFQLPVLAFLQRYLGAGDDAPDLAQETFVKAFFQLDKFDDQRAFEPWLFTIAANLARDFLRKRKREALVFQDVGEDDPAETQSAKLATDAGHHAAPDALLSRQESRRALEAAIARLPLSLREPILLHYQLDWPVAEIAQHLKLDEGTVKVRLHRARRKLHEMLDPESLSL